MLRCMKKFLNFSKSCIIIVIIIFVVIFLFTPKDQIPVFYISKSSPDEFITNSEYSIYEIKHLGNPKHISLTTVVTTLFRFSKSKHASDAYDEWSKTMIKSMGAPIVAFIDYNWANKFIERCKLNNITGNNTLYKKFQIR